MLATTLVAGVWVDRLPRRPILMATDLGSALAIGSIPGATVLGWLRLEHLYAMACAARYSQRRQPRPQQR